MALSLTPGSVLADRYSIEQQIGSGGFGAVYRVRDLRLSGALRALKVANAAGVSVRREADLLTQLNHPALPQVYDTWGDAEGTYLVLDYIPDDDLEHEVERLGRGLPLDLVQRWIDELADVVIYLHGHQPPLLHRDIKPQNLKVAEDGQLMLLDFGIAKGALPGMTTPLMTQAGFTPHYAPLEQIRGAATDQRTDLYGLAATIYRLATGVRPPDALERAAALIKGEPDPLRPARSLRPDLPAPLSEALQRALALDPAHRYSSVVTFLADARRTEVVPTRAPLVPTYSSPSLSSTTLRQYAFTMFGVGSVLFVIGTLLPVFAGNMVPNIALLAPLLAMVAVATKTGAVVTALSLAAALLSYFLPYYE